MLFSAGCIKVVNMVPAALSAETNQDSEPFLSVHPQSPNVMIGSAFTPNPAGTASGLAPVYMSDDNGDTWTLRNIVPSASALSGTSDITHTFDSGGGDLYAGILRGGASLRVDELKTSNLFAAMTLQDSRIYVDQPFIQARTMGGNDRIYVGNNDFGPSFNQTQTATVDISLDGGATYNPVVIETRATPSQDGPSVRPAVSKDGTVYAAYFGWRSRTGNVSNSDIVVVRDDNGGTGSSPFQDLIDPSDSLAGRIVAANVPITWSNAPTLGQERIGSTLTLAVHPNNSSIVYVGWCDDTGGGMYNAHVRRSLDRGLTWSGDLRTIPNATCIALAIANNGTVGLLYQQLSGGRWVTHLEQTRDGFSSIKDTVLADVPGNVPSYVFLPYIGDYNYLLAVGGRFRGIFSACNKPDRGNFPSGVKYQRKANFFTRQLLDLGGNDVPVSIDPFYFSVPVKH
jgi:hypothetical protein